MVIVRRLTFEFQEEEMIDSFRIRIEGTTDNVLSCFHVAERVQVSVSIDPELIVAPGESPYDPEPQRITNG